MKVFDMRSTGQLLIFFGVMALWGSTGAPLHAKGGLLAMACALALGIALIAGGIVLVLKSKPKS
jgi:hypothetical protein